MLNKIYCLDMLLDEFLIFKENFSWELRAQILIYELFLYMCYFQISLLPPSIFCFLSMRLANLFA